MTEKKITMNNGMYYPPASYSQSAWVGSVKDYQTMYDQSVQKTEDFWGKVAEEFHWEK